MFASWKKNSEAIKMTFGSSAQKVPFAASTQKGFIMRCLNEILKNAEYIL